MSDTEEEPQGFSDQAVMRAYQDRFGDIPNMMHVEAKWDEAIKLLDLALDTDEGYEGNEFYELLDMPPPPDNVRI